MRADGPKREGRILRLVALQLLLLGTFTTAMGLGFFPLAGLVYAGVASVGGAVILLAIDAIRARRGRIRP